MRYNGGSACSEHCQAIPLVSLVDHGTLPSGNTWTCQQNNANNAYNVTIPSGSVNNNNKNNTNAVVPVAELYRITDELFYAEEDCYRNKKRKMEACKFHYHVSQLFELNNSIVNGTYSPSTSTCFVLTYPRYREVFAANYRDRIVHHLLAPFILQVTEKVHIKNGNISHGNRVGYSALTAAKQIQKNMLNRPNGMVAHFDVSGFFMNINRDMAYNVFVKFCNKTAIKYYTQHEVDLMLALLKVLINHDPTSNCKRNSPMWMWEHVASNKTLFGNEGKGLPIGNFYSQLIANLVLAVWAIAIYELGISCDITQFVDDMCVVADNIKDINAIRKRSDSILRELGLCLHKTKYYIQPVKHGVKFCGRVIYGKRMHIGDRTIRACKNSIKRASKNVNERNASRLLCSFNSYMGFMYGMETYKVQRMLADMVLDTGYRQYLYFDDSNGKVVCKMYEEYKPINKHIQELRELNLINKQDIRNGKYRHSHRSSVKRDTKEANHS